jgi:hypothetical protein
VGREGLERLTQLWVLDSRWHGPWDEKGWRYELSYGSWTHDGMVRGTRRVGEMNYSKSWVLYSQWHDPWDGPCLRGSLTGGFGQMNWMALICYGIVHVMDQIGALRTGTVFLRGFGILIKLVLPKELQIWNK